MPSYRPGMGRFLQALLGLYRSRASDPGMGYSCGRVCRDPDRVVARAGLLPCASALTCGAEARGGKQCRNNSHGILLGCWIRQHKWQRVKDVFVSRRWRGVFHDLMGTTKDKLGTIGALIAVVSLFVSRL